MWLASQLRLRTGTLLHPAVFVDNLIFSIPFQAIAGTGHHYFATLSHCLLRSTHENVVHSILYRFKFFRIVLYIHSKWQGRILLLYLCMQNTEYNNYTFIQVSPCFSLVQTIQIT
jgi:hypothetical protein